MGKKEKAEARARRRRNKKIKQALIWILILAGIGALIYFFAQQADQSGQERPGEAIPIIGADHIQVGAEHPPYNSNPPTSGSHYPQPAAWGVYESELPDEQVVHNLEHGGIWIAYHPDRVDEDAKDSIERIGRRNRGSVVVTPRAANDAPIAVASWGRLMKLDSFDEAQINEFIARNKNRSPEPLAL